MPISHAFELPLCRKLFQMCSLDFILFSFPKMYTLKYLFNKRNRIQITDLPKSRDDG